jgi:hypothetical protein
MTTQRAGEPGDVAHQRSNSLPHAFRARLAHRLARRAALRARADDVLCTATAAALLLPQVALIVGIFGGAA